MLYFSTKEVSSSHPPADNDVGFLSMMCMRNLKEDTKPHEKLHERFGWLRRHNHMLLTISAH